VTKEDAMSELKDAVRPYGVAIDYDDTFTTCPETWTEVCEVLRAAGARVFCVSSRTPEMAITDFPGEVFYTSAAPKAEYMAEQGVEVHIWIDDMPYLIGIDPLKRELRDMCGLD
jgi:hypothetical protein